MEYQRKRPLTPSAGPHQPTVRAEVPAVSHHAPLQRAMQRFTSTPTTAQRQAVIPVLRAASLHWQEEEHLSTQRLPLQRQVAELRADLPADAIQTALQRQASERSLTAVPAHPQTAGEWVTVMRHRAEQMDGARMDARSMQAFTALQRQVTAALVQGVKHDSSPAIQRQAAFAEHAVRLQRNPLTRHIPRAALAQLPPGERLSLQRAVDEATQADALQRQQDAQVLQLHSLQRHLADLDEQATKPVMERIQARRGGGNPLPAAVQRHLEQGLNHDLSAVRIHDDAEADKLAKGVNATAFTTGTDIYFRSGRFNPNTQSGLELLAHEVTHTVQQSQGKVSQGIDPDPDLEQEARAMGAKLAGGAPSQLRSPLKTVIPSKPGMLQRTPAGNVKENPYSTTNAAAQGNFCKPYTSKELGDGTFDKDYLVASAGVFALKFKFGPEAQSLWALYLRGGTKKRVEITEGKFPNIYRSFVKAKASKFTGEIALANIEDLIRAKKIPLQTGKYQISKHLKDYITAYSGMLRYTTEDPIPGNLAGALDSGSDFGKDERRISGDYSLKRLSGNKWEIALNMVVEVLDAIDLCPGAPGTSTEQILTTPLSRLEKAGVTGDVGFRVVYPIRLRKVITL